MREKVILSLSKQKLLLLSQEKPWKLKVRLNGERQNTSNRPCVACKDTSNCEILCWHGVQQINFKENT